MSKLLKASIIIPSLGRSEALERCLDSIAKQTVKPHEIIIRGEEGPLAAIRNRGAYEATGDVFIFIDDDTYCPPFWLESILERFDSGRHIGGVSGPAIIRSEHRTQRDIFRYPRIKALYDRFFLDGLAHLPGHITSSGTWTTGACEEGCDYEGSVHFLEACNMAFLADAFREVGGFDEAYGGVGDWSEPDICYRIRKAGYTLWFNPKAALYHEPSRTGAFKKRKKVGARLTNYFLFARRWVKPHWKHTAYKLFLRAYFSIKELGIA